MAGSRGGWPFSTKHVAGLGLDPRRGQRASLSKAKSHCSERNRNTASALRIDLRARAREHSAKSGFDKKEKTNCTTKNEEFLTRGIGDFGSSCRPGAKVNQDQAWMPEEINRG